VNYEKIYSNLITLRRNEPTTGYTENHHILPKSLGGTDTPGNRVRLTGREHWVAHLLLHKIHKKPQTIHACHMMAMRCEERGIPTIKSSRMYQRIREEQAKLASRNGKKRVGDKNGSYGTMWISNIDLKQNRKIKKSEPIPVGWTKGRNSWKPKFSRNAGRIKLSKRINITNGKENVKISFEDQLPIPSGWYEGQTISPKARNRIREHIRKHNKALKGTSGQGGHKKRKAAVA
jgi:hypothetical protein